MYKKRLETVRIADKNKRERKEVTNAAQMSAPESEYARIACSLKQDHPQVVTVLAIVLEIVCPCGVVLRYLPWRRRQSYGAELGSQ